MRVYLVLIVILCFFNSCKPEKENNVETVLAPVSHSAELFDRKQASNEIVDSFLRLKADTIILRSQYSRLNRLAGKLDTIFYYNKNGLLYVSQGSSWQDSIKLIGFYAKGKLFKIEGYNQIRKGWKKNIDIYLSGNNFIEIGNHLEGSPDVISTMKSNSQRFKELIKWKP